MPFGIIFYTSNNKNVKFWAKTRHICLGMSLLQFLKRAHIKRSLVSLQRPQMILMMIILFNVCFFVICLQTHEVENHSSRTQQFNNCVKKSESQWGCDCVAGSNSQNIPLLLINSDSKRNIIRL